MKSRQRLFTRTLKRYLLNAEVPLPALLECFLIHYGRETGSLVVLGLTSLGGDVGWQSIVTPGQIAKLGLIKTRCAASRCSAVQSLTRRSFTWPDSEKKPRFFSQTCCGTSHGRVHPSCACALRLCCSAHCAQQHNLGPLQKFELGEKWQVPHTPPLRTHLRPDCTAGR